MNTIEGMISNISKLLPNIRPIQNFLHLNMFPDQLEFNFWDVLEKTSIKYSYVSFPPIHFYQSLYEKGEINPEILESLIKISATSPAEADQIHKALFRPKLNITFPEKSDRPIHRHISEKIGHSINELCEPLLIRFLSAFYDQGISFWNLPLNQDSLLKCFFALNLNSFFPIYPLRKKFIKEMSGLSALEIIELIYSKLFDTREFDELYCEESLLALKGWSGMIKTIHNNPALIIEKRNGTLAELLAIRLMIEYSWVLKLNPKLLPFKISEIPREKLTKVNPLTKQETLCFKIWQQALERSFQAKTLKGLVKHIIRKPPVHEYKYQAFFCIDDRECMLVRNLEGFAPDVQTFGTPGHFGLDFMFKESPEAYPKKSCPAPIPAPYTINLLQEVKLKQIYGWQNSPNQIIFMEHLSTFRDGIMSAVNLFIQTFFPEKNKEIMAVNFLPPKKLQIFNDKTGYNFELAADRISAVLKSINLTSKFCDFVFIIGHYSTTTNNPYYTAYGCGACSGRTGEINAQVFSEMANHQEVRKLLLEKHQLEIPDQTQFIPGYHDTCKDQITLFVDERLETHHDIYNFRLYLKKALSLCALNRIKDFELAPRTQSATLALEVLSARSQSIFEPRPELGHSNNALVIICDKTHIRDFSFDRRAFLQSYALQNDPEGQLLEGIFMATVPVCGGINLDYLFSKMNNLNVGAGSKLSHNITGLIGLTNGTEDDLLTGLAYQMIELHQPLRITFFVEQSNAIIQKVLDRNEFIRKWFDNEWILLTTLDPQTKELYLYHQKRFQTFKEVIPC
jgi:uncharacterized protein YbcC (UPF0753/DUF2309 family)